MEFAVTDISKENTGDDRRDFLKKCGTFAAITPPAVTFLLSTSMSSKAIAASSGRRRRRRRFQARQWLW